GLAPRAPPDDSKVAGAVVRTTVTVQRGRRDLSWNDSTGPTLSFGLVRAATAEPGAAVSPWRTGSVGRTGHPGKPGHPEHCGQSARCDLAKTLGTARTPLPRCARAPPVPSWSGLGRSVLGRVRRRGGGSG